MKHYLPLLLLIFFSSQAFSQSNSSYDYKSLVKTNKDQVDGFMQSNKAMMTANLNYIETIQNIFESGKVKVEGSSNRSTAYRQQQLDWMLYAVPILASTTPDKDQLNESIELWVSDFCKEFGLTYENKNSIRGSLAAYVQAYELYHSKCFELQKTVGYGMVPPPSVPPPPPPQQQHHRN